MQGCVGCEEDLGVDPREAAALEGCGQPGPGSGAHRCPLAAAQRTGCRGPGQELGTLGLSRCGMLVTQIGSVVRSNEIVDVFGEETDSTC